MEEAGAALQEARWADAHAAFASALAIEETGGLAREAHAKARQDGDRDLELCALGLIGVSLVEQGRVAQGVRCLDESMAVALGAAGRPDTVVFTSCMMMTSCTRCAGFARPGGGSGRRPRSASGTAARSSTPNAASSTARFSWPPATGGRPRPS